jgi:hypothetical protein
LRGHYYTSADVSLSLRSAKLNLSEMHVLVLPARNSVVIQCSHKLKKRTHNKEVVNVRISTRPYVLSPVPLNVFQLNLILEVYFKNLWIYLILVHVDLMNPMQLTFRLLL